MAVSLQRALCLLMWIIIAGQQSVTTLCADDAKLELLSGSSGPPGQALHDFSANKVFLGSVSCSAASCHGGPLPGVKKAEAQRGSEYLVWMEQDPHASSWRTLCSDKSLEILEKLQIVRDSQLVNKAAFDNCLACHNTTKLEFSVANNHHSPLTPEVSEGVGCEACHGPAPAWYRDHFRTSFQKVGRSDSNQLSNNGFIDLKPLLQRAKQCAKCHVGAADRDMNHDLIAAGHPTLNFEFAAYHEALPKHWRESNENTPDQRAKLWLAGQFAVAQAELELTIARAEQSHAEGVWPELSMFQCSNCHQTLKPAAPNLTADLVQPPAKNPILDSSRLTPLSPPTPRRWNYGGIESTLMACKDALNHNIGDQLASYHGSLLELGFRSDQVSRHEVAKQARALAQSLQVLEVSRFSDTLETWNSRSQAKIALQLVEADQNIVEWEMACRTYSAVWSASSPVASPLNESLKTLREGLLYRAGSQSSNFPRQDSQGRSLDLQKWRQAVETTRRELEKLRL